MMPESIKMAFVGDIMCGDFFHRIGSGVASQIDRYGESFLPYSVTEILKGHDLVLGNIECVLSDVGRSDRSLRSLHMRGRPRFAQHLAKWGLTVAHVANNHILEHGEEAAIDTVHQLEEAGLTVIGLGRDRQFAPGVDPVIMEAKGVSVALIGACFHCGRYAFDSTGMKKKILEVVKAHASSSHTVIVSLHWGDEYIDRPALWQRDYAKSIVNAGATLLIGHHPHVVQGIEHAGRSLIAYSLGNFIFDMISEDVNWSVILSITIRDRKVVDWTCVPISCGRDFRPELASGARKRHLEEEILRRNKLACMKIENRKDYCEEYFTAAKKLERFHRRLLWKQTGRNFFSLKPIFWPQVLLRPTQRRLGWW